MIKITGKLYLKRKESNTSYKKVREKCWLQINIEKMTEIERENRILCEKMRHIYLSFNPLLDESNLTNFNLQD